MIRSGLRNLNQFLNKLSLPPPPLVLSLGQTMMVNTNMTVRNVGTVGLVPQIATGAGTPEGTSLHTGLGGAVPPPHHTGTKPISGQVQNLTFSHQGTRQNKLFVGYRGPV